MIKIAEMSDLPTIMNMAEKFIAEANYVDFTDRDEYERLTISVLEADKRDKIILLDDDIGILVGITSKLPFANKAIAVELMWWVDPAHRSKKVGENLLSAFEYWAKQVGAKYINMTCLDERVGKFYENNGYALYERVYMKEI